VKITKQARVRKQLAVSQAESNLLERANEDASKLHPPATRSERETNLLMSILDELQAGEVAP
jgi:hypothetical protein